MRCWNSRAHLGLFPEEVAVSKTVLGFATELECVELGSEPVSGVEYVVVKKPCCDWHEDLAHWPVLQTLGPDTRARPESLVPRLAHALTRPVAALSALIVARAAAVVVAEALGAEIDAQEPPQQEWTQPA